MVVNVVTNTCDLCGQGSKTILLLGINNTVPCVYRQCSECEVEYLTAKESSINMYVKKMVKNEGVINPLGKLGVKFTKQQEGMIREL